MAENRKILWITNLMPGFLAKQDGLAGSNKEGWVEGLVSTILKDTSISLGIAFPGNNHSTAAVKSGIWIKSFYENSNQPELYEDAMVKDLEKTIDEFSPDVIHIFGTEFPHTRAVMEMDKWRDKALIHIQGLMAECEKVYTASLPDYVVNRITLRDFLRHDSIKEQLNKYSLRARNEYEALIRAKWICGRTDFDKRVTEAINPKINYSRVNESLRSIFYNESWNLNECNVHEIFVSQGNYPLKGVHDVIEAVGQLKEEYPDIKLYVAGDKITSYDSLKDKIKLSSYGKYLRELIKKYNVSDNIIFTGSLSADEMLKRYKSAEVFILSSYVENSPNSLGEAMLIGMPAIASKVGGVTSMATEGQETLMYPPGNIEELKDCIRKIFEDATIRENLGNKARIRAAQTHNRDKNNEDLINCYKKIMESEA